MNVLVERIRQYRMMIKLPQTGLLVLTGLSGFMSARCPVTSWRMLPGIGGSLFLAVSGSTILNMVMDRDIDRKMSRTAGRPLPAGEISKDEALVVGLVFSAAGLMWSLHLGLLYGLVVFTGIVLDAVVYTKWLKRRTSWSILWGGISGAMPLLAGRVLAVGQIDLTGILLALAVLFWIPTHIMTFGIKYAEDYLRAGVPVFANTHGEERTRIIIGVSTTAAAVAMIAAAHRMEMVIGFWRAQIILAVLLLILTFTSILRPSQKINFGLFKMASLYMVGSMLLILLGL